MGEAQRCWAGDYGNALLRDLDAGVSVASRAELHPALRWAHSGCMALTGERGGPPQMCPVPLAAYADGLLAALAALQPDARLAQLDGAALLGERAALAQLQRAGAVSAGGACRLLPAADGWLAVNLARVHDWELLPAWLECDATLAWPDVAAVIATRAVEECVVRGRLLGLAVTALSAPQRSSSGWFHEFGRGPQAAKRRQAARVVDLSSLWAGPLCSHLLQQLGAEVIKVESALRPDGLRVDRSGFFDLLNAGKASVALDLTQPAARAQLRRLLLSADIVIEGSRPRALRQLGIVAEDFLAQNPGLTWLAISGYGRDEPQANWIAYGDDAAVAAGLAQILRDCSARPLFCADAIADPLTGLHAALAAWSSYLHGGGRGIALALREVVAHGVAFAWLADATSRRARAAAWERCVSPQAIQAPRARPLSGAARALGADTAAVLDGLGR
jgi:hypothetical protein